MTEDAKKSKSSTDLDIHYELLPPEGGWGYMVIASVVVMFIVTFVPMTAFGLIFGKFLASVGDETTGTALANGIFNTILNFTGLASNHLLQKYSCRTVAFIGAFLYCTGSFTTLFVTSMFQMIVSFGVIQGLGFGLLMPATYTALNSYFDKKINLIMGIAQALIIVAGMIFPIVAKILISNFGFRGTVAILAAFSLNTFFSAVALQPVEWHMKKREMPRSKSLESLRRKHMNDLKTRNAEEYKLQMEPLVENRTAEKLEDFPKYISQKPRKSIISIGDKAMSVTTINKIGLQEDLDEQKELNSWQQLIKSMVLFKDFVYLNIACGLGLGYTADVAFISIIPLYLSNAGYDTSQAAFLITVHFASDLVSRILLSIVSGICVVRNRYIFLVGAILSAVFRVGFVMYDTYYWTLCMIGILGFLRCFIQTPLPLVISEKYQDNFATAFSLYMVVCGVISLIFGPLMSVVKSVTGSDIMVVHLLTAAYALCGITWTVELVCSRKQ